MSTQATFEKIRKWDHRFIHLAELISGWSKDRSTQVGCVIVNEDREIVATGYNGFPRNVNEDDEERHERPIKYLYAEHGERNAIYQAAKRGTSLLGCTLYAASSPDRLGICCDCARAIIQSGIKIVVMEKPDFDNERWGDQTKIAHDMLLEGGVRVLYINPDGTYTA